MAEVKVNFDDAPDFSPLPPGRYLVAVSHYETRVSKGGEDYLNWTLTVLEGPGDTTDNEGRKLFTPTMLKGPGSFRLRELLRATKQFEEEELQEMKKFDPDHVLGEKIVAIVHHEEFNGELTSKVKRLTALSDW